MNCENKQKIVCAYCNRGVDLENIGNRIVPPYYIVLEDQRDTFFCSATCGNKYCIDNNIPFRFCINPNCAERGPYYKKTIIIPPHAIYCSYCSYARLVICKYCGRKYNSNRSKARKANEPERFCSIKCEKLFHREKMSSES